MFFIPVFFIFEILFAFDTKHFFIHFRKIYKLENIKNLFIMVTTAAAVVGIGVGIVGAVTNVVGMVKNLDDIKDNTRQRWIDLNNKANISETLSQEERDGYMEKRNEILNKYPDKGKIPEEDLWELAKIETLMNGQKCDIKDQTKFAVENIKNVEMKQNVFENQLQNFGERLGNVEITVQKHGEMLIDHENRIGRLENTVDLH
jgi:hypothetical protein